MPVETKQGKLLFRWLSPGRLMAAGFLLLIAIGTLLLMLPFSAAAGKHTSFMTAFFTSVSACCVTGLTVADTFSQWSLFGQIVLLVLIQIGGLSFITIGTAVSIMLGNKLGLRQRGWIKESLNINDMAGISRLIRTVFKGTALIEAAGALLLSVRFIPLMGWGNGIWYGIFHSVSAFCNAGFDLMGTYGMSSFCGFSKDPVVVITVCMLILTGGIGFIVWQDILRCGIRMKKYTLQTKMVLSMSAALVLIPAILFFFTERDAVFQGMSLGERLLSSLFTAVTPRTAGFNIIEYSDMSEGGKLLTTALMFVGGGSGSTAGGVKMTTVFALLLHLRATVRRYDGVNIFGRRLDENTLSKATAVLSIYLFLSCLSSFLICAAEGFPIGDTVFEVVSAICTVGISAGLTRKLGVLSQLILIFLMYTGRLNSLSFALSFTDNKRSVHIKQPAEDISVG